MKPKNIIIFLLFTMILPLFGSVTYVPIQEQGRIKPFDSFARNQLLALSGKIKFTAIENEEKYKISASDWLLSVLVHNSETLEQRIFKIENPDVAKTLSIIVNEKHLYSFNEIEKGLTDNWEFVSHALSIDDDNKTLIEKQILELWIKKEIFTDLWNGAGPLIPSIKISSEFISNALGITTNEYISFSYYHRNKNKIQLAFQEAQQLFPMDSILKYEIDQIEGMAVLSLIDLMKSTKNKKEHLLKLIPSKNKVWLSPNELIYNSIKDNKIINETQNEIIIILEKIFKDYLNKGKIDKQQFNKYQTIISENSNVKTKLLIREVNYNNANLFLWSLIFYILSLIALTALSMIKSTTYKYKFIPLILISIGFLYHVSGIIIRMTILKRPPVSTLYESIIFVGFIAVLLAIILELVKKDNISLLIGAVAGIILHYISFGYAADGDTLGVLVAVLNSNFWLATHVTTITAGYGITIITSLIGHLYLVKANWNPKSKQLKIIYNNMVAMTFIALFFTMFGTILGGIWGDQSWGRFWGWDPKENGALLIVMWLLMMVHLRISGMAQAPGYAFGLVLANITVALAWFGGNLLNVGLHSYGFTDGVALNLLLFVIFELVLGISLYTRLKLKTK